MEDGGKRYSCSNALGQSEAPQIDIYWNERRDHVHLEYMCSRERFRNRFTSKAGKISAAFIFAYVQSASNCICEILPIRHLMLVSLQKLLARNDSGIILPAECPNIMLWFLLSIKLRSCTPPPSFFGIRASSCNPGWHYAGCQSRYYRSKKSRDKINIYRRWLVLHQWLMENEVASQLQK